MQLWKLKVVLLLQKRSWVIVMDTTVQHTCDTCNNQLLTVCEEGVDVGVALGSMRSNAETFFQLYRVIACSLLDIACQVTNQSF